MKYQELLESIKSAAGLRLRLRLQPMYGEGELIFPSTVAGGNYLISPRRIPNYDEPIPCAIVDSVQSQANRLELALLDDIKAKKLHIPHIATNFSKVEGLAKTIGTITCFDAPHRIFDAIIRDSINSSNTHFPFTDQGKAAINATSKNATAIFQISPASLLFGSWDSTGVSGGLGEKYTRCVVSELVGINCLEASRGGVRVDPLNIAASLKPDDIQKKEKDAMWAELKKKSKFSKPSEINHSSVPWGNDAGTHGGISVDYIQQATTISFPALRQLRFPVAGKDENETSSKAQAVLAAIALHACALNVEKGWHLRSRCDLVLDQEKSEWEILGHSPRTFELDSEVTRSLLLEAIKEAKAADLPWNDEAIQLTPSEALATLVTKSQQNRLQSIEQE